MLAKLFASGRIVDWILLLLACEWVAVLVAQRMLKRSLGVPALLVGLGAGLALLLALRESLLGAPWQAVAAWLAAAFVAHIFDLHFRLKRAGP
jgi:CBS-domain-containing membrane protein